MPSSQSTSTPSASKRLHGLDAVRGFALLLGVILHATMSFLPGAAYIWIIPDSSTSIVLAPVFFVIHSFRMMTFFLMAGFFAHMSIQRLGLKNFMGDRFRRIAIPLFVGWPLVFSAIVAVLVWSAMIKNGGKLPTETSPGPAFTPSDFPLTHLWFLYELLFAYLVAILVRLGFSQLDKTGKIQAFIDRGIHRIVNQWCPILFALPLWLSLYAAPDLLMWFGIPTPDQTLYPNLPAVSGYGLAFALGWLIHRQMDLMQIWQRRWLFNLICAIIFTTLCLTIAGLAPSLTPSPQDTHKLIFTACYSMAAWSWTFAVMGMGLRFWSDFNATRRYLADASYWIYIVHLPLVMALQIWFANIALPWPIKLPLLLLIAFALMLTSYQFFVRNSFIGARLNGRRISGKASQAIEPVNSATLAELK